MADTFLNSAALVSRNTYQYNNSTIFYSLINNGFLPYYQKVIRKAQEWLDGYDPSFHKNDMISTRIAARLFNGFKNALFGRGLIFIPGRNNTEKDNKTLNYISHEWADKSGIQNAVKQLIGYTIPLGTGALKINRSSDGVFWVEPLRIDYFYFTVDGRRNVVEFTSFIRCFQSTEDEQENYFLVEKRYFKFMPEKFREKLNGKEMEFEKKVRKPVVEYRVYHYRGIVNQNTMPSVATGDGVNYKNLPEWVKDSLKETYSAYKVGEPQALPFVDYLGVELFFNEGGDITNPTLPFGRVLCFDCLSDFMEFDMNKSYSIRDLYNSKGIVGIPKALSIGNLTGKAVPGTSENVTYQSRSAYSKLNIPGYELIPGLDPNNQKPIINQFDMRVTDHENKDMAILKSIATIIGVSPRAIASYLIQNGEKTDDQIQSEDDTVTQWIKAHREDYILGINRIIECVLNAQGYHENVEVRFASDGLLKGDKQLESVRQRLDMGVIDIEDAVRELNPDLDEEQLRKKIDKALAIQHQKVMDSFDELNIDGTFGNNEEPNKEQNLQ